MEVYESRQKYGENKLNIKEEFWLWTLGKLFLEPMSIMLEVMAQLTTFRTTERKAYAVPTHLLPNEQRSLTFCHTACTRLA